MASNEYNLSVTEAADAYKLTVVDGTELTLTLDGGQGPVGPNSVTTSTATDLTGYIYGNGTNVAGATAGVSESSTYGDYYFTIPIRGDFAEIRSPQFALGLSPNETWITSLATEYQSAIFPNASGYVAVIGTKNTTGDYATGTDGQIVTNTFDNNVKIYADGGWRQIASW